ncbi:unnamed protein product [Oreochromis niloticus]|nr:unnamed protein product [Mustela putorius furo]
MDSKWRVIDEMRGWKEGERQRVIHRQGLVYFSVFCCLMVPSAVTNLCILLLSHDTCLISYHLSYGLFNVYSLRSTQPCPPALSAAGAAATPQQQHCTHQAFSELQVKMIDTQQKVKMADLQIDQLTRVQKHAKLTHAEIATLPDNTRLYEGVGRMFILQSKEEINNLLTDKQKTADEKIKELEQRKVYLERSVKEAEDNIREMLLSRRAH